MKLGLFAAAVLPALVIASPAAAQIVAEAGVAHAEGDTGAEISAGVPVIKDGGFALTPGGGVFFHHRDHPGYEETNSQCFSEDTGEQVSDGKCDNSGTKLFGKVEATYSLPMSFTFGVGARFIGGDLRAYGTVAMPLAPRFDAKANFGDHYISAGLQARF